jgi:hypothetical protein
MEVWALNGMTTDKETKLPRDMTVEEMREEVERLRQHRATARERRIATTSERAPGDPKPRVVKPRKKRGEPEELDADFLAALGVNDEDESTIE